MKAIVRHKYGTADALELASLPKPVPAENEVLIRVVAAALNPFDWHMMRGTPWPLRLFIGFPRPKSIRLGADVAGTIVGVGTGVTEFRLGDEVFGAADGSLAEYVCAPVSTVVLKPANASDAEAAAVPIAGLTALQALRDKGLVKAGDKVLIHGASGGVGTFAVQIAKWFGARVTCVCSGRNLELVRGIGADHVVDYSREDFAAGSEKYDVVFDLVGNRKLADIRRALTTKGIYIGCGGGGPDMPTGRLLWGLLEQKVVGWFVRQKLVGVLAKRDAGDLEILSKLLATGKIKPVIDRRYGLAEVPEAIRYVEQGHARGKVIIQI